jgi:1-acyl-sn-glycerol-3-phosphate acyltransferase
MFKSLLQTVRGVLSILFYTLNTVLCFVPILVVTLVKLLVPIRWVQNGCRRILNAIANFWISVNNLNQRIFNNIDWQLSGLKDLNPKGWYLVVANHQSWVDIMVLQNVFYRKIPFLKFFLKKELFWFPVLGQAWWALDFPFMKRYDRKFLKKHPHLIGKDLEITKRACEKFRHIPVSIMNFVEGTRFTPEKRDRQRSPYTHLLRTRAGGMAFVLGAMGDKLQQIVDVTIAYPQGICSFWDFVCGRVTEVKVHVNTLPVTHDLIGDYRNDPEYKRGFQRWLNALWHEKDAQLDSMLTN